MVRIRGRCLLVANRIPGRHALAEVSGPCRCRCCRCWRRSNRESCRIAVAMSRWSVVLQLPRSWMSVRASSTAAHLLGSAVRSACRLSIRVFRPVPSSSFLPAAGSSYHFGVRAGPSRGPGLCWVSSCHTAGRPRCAGAGCAGTVTAVAPGNAPLRLAPVRRGRFAPRTEVAHRSRRGALRASRP